jgi:hypothetical protein
MGILHSRLINTIDCQIAHTAMMPFGAGALEARATLDINVLDPGVV